MEIEILKQVVEIFQKAGVSKLSIKKGDLEICLENITQVPLQKEEKNMKEIKDISLEHIVVSPMIGCFYRANSPKDEPFVEIGDLVKKGDVLCIVEAMKVMIEVKAERSGIIKKIKVRDGDMVEFGKSLFVME